MSPRITPQFSSNPQDAQNQESTTPQGEAFVAWQKARSSYEQTQSAWDAEYNFWHKIISQEVERLRFNGGYEPIEVDLYPSCNPDFLGKTQVGRTHFQVTAKRLYDATGRKVLRVRILKAP